MITYRKAVQLLNPGDVVFSLDELGGGGTGDCPGSL
jgi:hypothetical protein